MTGGGIVPPGSRRNGGNGVVGGGFNLDDNDNSEELRYKEKNLSEHPPVGYVPPKREGFGSRLVRRIKSFRSSESKG